MSDADLFTDAPVPSGGDLFTDEPAPKSVGGFAENVLKNTGKVLNPLNILEGMGEQVKQGAFDMPMEATNTLANKVAEAVGGEKDDTAEKTDLEHLVQDPTMEKRAQDIGNSDPVQHPVDFAYKNPVDAAFTVAAPLLGFEGASAAEEAGANVPRGTIPPEIPKAPLELPPAAPKGLPIIPPGAKTGDPHALFSYNDNFGPGGKPRSMYTMYGDPEHPIFKQTSATGGGGHGSTLPKSDIDALGVPVTGREPRTVGKWDPLDLGEETTPLEKIPEGKVGKSASMEAAEEYAKNPPKEETAIPAKEDPFKDVRDYIASKGAKIEAKGGWPEKVAKYLKNEANDLGAKDIGLQGRQIQSMGPGFEGVRKAEQLVDYAREKGYLDPSLTDVARKDKIISTTKETGAHLDAIRNVGNKRGAPPLDAIKQAVKQELEAKYGAGTEKATAEIANVMDDINKAEPTFSGMSDLATKLNRSATKVKDLGQHPGPTTDAANIVSRINNDALRGVLNPQESELYTKSLRDYGAHKKLEQAVAGANRRSMTGRSNQRGPFGRLWQEALDRGGYRIGGNVANKVADTILKNPGKIKTLPQFFEELAHQSDDTLDDALGISGMYQGGRVPDDVRQYVSSREC